MFTKHATSPETQSIFAIEIMCCLMRVIVCEWCAVWEWAIVCESYTAWEWCCPQKRVLQVAEDEAVIDYACRRSHANLWAKTLRLKGLQNTHTDLCARTARYSDFPSMKWGEIVDGKTGVTTVYEEMPVFIKLLIVNKFNLWGWANFPTHRMIS